MGLQYEERVKIWGLHNMRGYNMRRELKYGDYNTDEGRVKIWQVRIKFGKG